MSQLRVFLTSGSVPTTNQLGVGDFLTNVYESRVYYKTLKNGTQKIKSLSNSLAYGQWQNNSTLSGSANVSHSFEYDTTDLVFKTYLIPPGKLYVQESGVYNIQFSTQLDEPGGGAATIYIWFKKNGVNIPESATAIDLANKGKLVAAWNFMTYLNEGDYVELMWQSNNANTQIVSAPPAGNIPAIPSIIITITQVY